MKVKSTPEDAVPEGWRHILELHDAVPVFWCDRAFLITTGTGLGVLSGPFLSAMVNHGNPGIASLVAAPFFLAFGALYGRVVALRAHQQRRHALLKAAAVLIGGGILFTLPHFLSLRAAGDVWWRTDVERYAVYCVPYPFVAWLVFARRDRRHVPTALVTVIAVALVLAWPKLELGATAQTAALLHREVGVPAASIYVLGFPGAHQTDGYEADRGSVSITYTIAGSAHPVDADPFEDSIYLGYDVALTAYPAQGKTSACASLDHALEDLLPDEQSGGDSESCMRQPDGRWQESDPYFDHLTQVELVGNYFVALTVNTQAVGLSQRFNALFASVHHPTTAEFVGTGLSSGWGWGMD